MLFKHQLRKSHVRGLIKSAVLLILIAVTPQVLADYDCHYFSSDGWQFGAICTSHFDNHGIYDYSYCKIDPYEDPSRSWHSMCKLGIDPGTCQGANCFQSPTCSWQGTCTNDFDCCGMNVCNLSSHQCREPGSGGGGRGGGSLRDFDNGYGATCSDDWDCDTGLHCEWLSNTCQY